MRCTKCGARRCPNCGVACLIPQEITWGDILTAALAGELEAPITISVGDAQRLLRAILRDRMNLPNHLVERLHKEVMAGRETRERFELRDPEWVEIRRE